MDIISYVKTKRVGESLVELAGEGRTNETVKGNADALAAHSEDMAAHGVDTKVSKSGDTLTGDLRFEQQNGGLRKTDNQGRMILTGGTGFSTVNGAYITIEGIDYTGTGLGGNIRLNIPEGKSLYFGTRSLTLNYGSPEGVVTAPRGSLYMRFDASPGAAFYVKEDGTGNTGWKAVQTVD